MYKEFIKIQVKEKDSKVFKEEKVLKDLEFIKDSSNLLT